MHGERSIGQSDEDLSRVRATVYADKPNKEIDQFLGTFTLHALVDHSGSPSHRNANDFIVVEPGSSGTPGLRGTSQRGVKVGDLNTNIAITIAIIIAITVAIIRAIIIAIITAII